MKPDINQYGQPDSKPLIGVWGQIERLECSTHARSLFTAIQQAPDQSNWTYLPYGPFDHFEGYRQWLESIDRVRL